MYPPCPVWGTAHAEWKMASGHEEESDGEESGERVNEGNDGAVDDGVERFCADVRKIVARRNPDKHDDAFANELLDKQMTDGDVAGEAGDAVLVLGECLSTCVVNAERGRRKGNPEIGSNATGRYDALARFGHADGLRRRGAELYALVFVGV